MGLGGLCGKCRHAHKHHGDVYGIFHGIPHGEYHGVQHAISHEPEKTKTHVHSKRTKQLKP